MTKKRRIQPIAVDDDAELEVATLPVPAFSAQPTDSTRIVDPPDEGRRIWVSLDEGYDFNFKKVLQSKGVKFTSRTKDAPDTQVMPAMPGMPGPPPMSEGTPGEQGNQMQKAMRRIERRVQREHMVAVTGNAEADSDEDMEDEDAEAADGDDAHLDEDGKDDNDKEDGEEEQEYQQSKGPKNQYDLNDDFIDDSEFIEAIQMRDDRKLKHQGFFVNCGAVERIGDRVPIVAAARARAKKKRPLPEDGEAQPDEQGTTPGKVTSKGTKKAAKKEAAKPGASEDSAPPAKVARAEDAATTTSAPEAAGAGLSLAEMALQAGADAAVGTRQADPSGSQTAALVSPIAASPAQKQGDAKPDVITSHGTLLSDRPPILVGAAPVTPTAQGVICQAAPGSSGAAPSPVTAANAMPEASTGVQLEAHAAKMRSFPLDMGPDLLVGLPDWSTTPRFREVLEEMREEAARTAPPGVSGTKKKMPQELTTCLETLVRPFYISADAAPNANKAKRAMWSLMMPILTPWSAENTIKTKMQKVNTQVLGAYQLEKHKLEGIAQWTESVGLQQGLNATRTLAIIRTFVDATSACDAIPLTAEDAELVWESVAVVWNNAGGPTLNGDLIQTLYRRSLEFQVTDAVTSELQQAAAATAAAGTIMPPTGN